MRASLTVAAAFAAAFHAGIAAAEPGGEPAIAGNAVTAGDECVENKTLELALSLYKPEELPVFIGGPEFERIKTDCVQSHGALNAEKDSTARIAILPHSSKPSADSCVFAQFNEVASGINAIPGVSLKLRMAMTDLQAMVAQCEQETASEAVIFKGMTQFSTTIGSVTFEFK